MRTPWWEFKGSTLELVFHVVLRHNGALIVQLNYHIKASVKLVTFDRENQIIPWQLQGVYFVTNTVLQKIIEAYCCDEKHGQQHW